jgi:hypothetical protein
MMRKLLKIPIGWSGEDFFLSEPSRILCLRSPIRKIVIMS